MTRLAVVLLLITSCTFWAFADPERVIVTKKSQQDDKITAFTLRAGLTGENLQNVGMQMEIPDHPRFANVGVTLVVHQTETEKTVLFIPIHLDRTEKDDGWKLVDIMLPADLARRAHFELLFHPSRIGGKLKHPPPPPDAIFYDVIIRSYIEGMK